MKNQIILTLTTIILLLSSAAKAQENTAFEKGTIVATVGYGFPDLYRNSLRVAYNGYSSRSVKGIGPLILKGDYGIVKFKWGHSVGAGIVLGYSSTKATYSYINYNTTNNTYTTSVDKYSTITIGARGSYHFFSKEKLDCYASIGIGFNINSYTEATSGYNAYITSGTTRSAIYETLTVGIRYYFTKNIGVYSEVGWDMSAPIQAGVALKF